MEATVERCAEIIDAGEPTQHVAINVAKVVALEDDPKLRDVVERCELVSVDGQPIVWASRLLGDPLPERVAGIDLMFRLLGLAEERGYRVYILGAKQEVLETAIGRLGERYPRLVVAGYHHGYFKDEESPEICELVRASEPHILFVAMSSPRKEFWLAEHARDLGVPFSMGVGGSIDVVAGLTKRAPALDAAHRARMVLPVHPGAAPPWPAIPAHERPVRGHARPRRRHPPTRVAVGAMDLLRRSAALPALVVGDTARRARKTSPARTGVPDGALEAAIRWLCLTHDVTGRRGSALAYHMLRGWRPAFPETTGYIIGTLLEHAAAHRRRVSGHARARDG